jgi:hypothetical protein
MVKDEGAAVSCSAAFLNSQVSSTLILDQCSSPLFKLYTNTIFSNFHIHLNVHAAMTLNVFDVA